MHGFMLSNEQSQFSKMIFYNFCKLRHFEKNVVYTDEIKKSYFFCIYMQITITFNNLIIISV